MTFGFLFNKNSFVPVPCQCLVSYEAKTSDNMIQYEIRAAEDEKDRLKALMEDIGNDDFEP